VQNTHSSPYFIHAIVLGYGKFKETSQHCLDSIVQEFDRKDIKISIIDNGSPDQSPQLQEEYAQQHPQINSIVLPQNLGFAGGMNYGANLYQADWLLLLGSDTILHPDAFQILYNTLQNIAPNIGLVGPVSNSAGTCQKLDLQQTNSSAIFQEINTKSPEPTNLLIPMYRADFFCVAIRKSLWDKLGGLDLAYGRGYYEDFDFCMRAQKEQYQSVMIEDMFVYHAGSSSFKSDPTQKQLIKQNKKIFKQKFPHAELRHLREDNRKVLEWYLQLDLSQLLKSGIYARLMLRWEAAHHNQPRSFYKKWLWRYKIQKIQKQLNKILKK
jgi:GT2 family glycosyltransferase